MLACTVVPGDPSSAAASQWPEPPETDGDVLVDGVLAGVCGTDAEIVRSGYGQIPAGDDKLVLFHESLGRVREAPAGSGFDAGDLVVGIVRRPDPVPCACCAQGQFDFCQNGRYTERGIMGRHGYGAQHWRVETDYAVRLDPVLGDNGVLMEPTSVVAKAWDQVERIGARACFTPERVLVTGAGPIGLLAALLGVQRGLDVHVLDRVTDGPKPELVRDLGATYHSGSIEDIGIAPDVVIECTGVGALVVDAVRHAAPNSITCLTGLATGSATDTANLTALNHDLVLGNDVVVGSVNANRHHYELAATALAAAEPEWLGRLISRRVPISEWSSALDKRDDDVKVVVDLQG